MSVHLLRVVLISMIGVSLLAFTTEERVTERGLYVVHAELVDPPAKVGKHVMRLSISERDSGEPADGNLVVEVVPWMPSMEHGSPEIPTVRRTAKGEFLVEGIYFSMSGTWEVYIRISAGEREDTVVFTVDVRQ